MIHHPTRRAILSMIGAAAGTSAMYAAMTALGHAAESPWKGPIRLDGDPKGARVLILGAGLAGMAAALELRAAGYQVEILEYRDKAGGRCWTLHSGDTYTEMGGFTQKVDFAEGNYINPGPWRIPYNHHALLDYCRRLGVPLEPFIQKNHNAYLHSSRAFDGKPMRFREIETDFRGNVSELLAKAVRAGTLDEALSPADREVLMASLKYFGALDDEFDYRKGNHSSEYRGWAKWPGGGADARPEPSDPLDFAAVLQSKLWNKLVDSDLVEFQETMFQPVGGMDRIAVGFEKQVGDLIKYNCKVTEIRQDDSGVTVTYVGSDGAGEPRTAAADWCLCTIPFSILSQIDADLSPEMKGVVDATPYAESVKFGLEFKRRFWEQDEAIYGGITYTDLPIALISYPSTGYQSDGPAVLLGGYAWESNANQFAAMSPEERIKWAVEFGARIHPQYPQEFKTGVSVVWHRVPWTLGCYALWREREANYDKATKIDGRILMAGEHVSYLPGWQEGAILSALDAISRLHDRVING
ncbi:MAG TPA: flavin monoamine oxidase family protein [Paracoccus sp. (in: a-proteobacteria)]|nr:flavin monoamine oxidase family protein [Paracoccus sp. (in: a-proteobacteria)]